TWADSNHSITIDSTLKRQIDFIENFLIQCSMNTPLLSELIPAAKKEDVNDEKKRKFTGFRYVFFDYSNYSW
ncbi:MAG: hypothetical protein ACFFC1_09515, partial [Promethearchaeota archaeon]